MKLLHGIRVLDVTTFLAGPLATRALADLGADVIKVEPPTGDPTRGGWTGEGEPSFYWRALHGGRRSIALDLAADSGRARFLELAAAADAVVENLRPGVMARFGLDGPTLRARFPRLVTCSIAGFEPDEELAGISATDGPVQAWTGAVDLMQAWSGVALPMPLQAGDIAGGAAAAQGVLAGLLARASTGEGAHIAVSLSAALTQWLGVADRSMTLAPPATLVLTGSDGQRFLVQAPLRFKPAVLAVFGIDPETPRGDIAELVQHAAERESAALWLDRLWAAGVPAAPVRPPAEDLPRPPWTVDGIALQPAGPPPALGANDAESWL